MTLALLEHTSPVWSYMQECSGSDSPATAPNSPGGGEAEAATEAGADRGAEAEDSAWA